MAIITSDATHGCAELSRYSPMAGTAEAVDVWILLEERGHWPAQAIAPDVLPPGLHRWLAGQVEALSTAGLRARPQLIRQETRSTRGRRLLLGHGGRLFALAALDDRALTELALVDVVHSQQQGPDRLAGARLLSEPHYFVCTNGRRDQCCARLGLPVYRQLRALVGDRVWRTTHVGGHRFAANVLTLGDGAVYGRVQVEDCQTLVASVDAGEIAFAWLRGRSSYPQHVQAAEALLAEQGLKLLHVEGSDADAEIVFAGSTMRHRIRVRRSSAADMVLAGCDKAAPKAVFAFERC